MKREIIAHMREKAGMTADEAEKALSSVVGAVKAVAERDGSARIPDFGTFTVKQRAERMGRNPMTGEPVRVAAKQALTFKEAKKRG